LGNISILSRLTRLSTRYNVVQAGNRNFETGVDFKEEIMEVFVDHSWLRGNIVSSMWDLNSRRGSLHTVEKVETGVYRDVLSEANEKVDGLTTAFDRETRELPKTIVAAQSRTEILRETLEMVRSHNRKMEEQVTFCKSLHSSLQGGDGPST
jgi:hypothetical protein